MSAIGDHYRPAATQEEEHFRHGHWKARRMKIREHLRRTGASENCLMNWDACGGSCNAEFSPSRSKYRLAANYCKNRHCEPCSRAKANLIARNLRARLEGEDAARAKHEGKSIRFITLTELHSHDPLVDQIKKLRRDFKELRRSKWWKNTQAGGAAILEVKWTGTAWHPHLHILSEGTYLDKTILSAEWRKVTKTSFIVDIRSLDRAADAAHYVCKYITKGTTPEVWNDNDLAQEWIIASKSIRVCDTFGTWRGFRLLKKTSGVLDWKHVDKLSVLIAKARAGDEKALQIVLELRPPGITDSTDGPPRASP